MRLYRWLLRHSATSLTREYGLAMEETFARRLADARRRGTLRVLYVWTRELAGLAALHLNERQWRAGPMDTAHREIRHAARRLWRSPAFSVAAALTLALAIGANTAIFAVVERVVINPLPYPESDRLIELDHGSHQLHVLSGFGTTAGLYFHYLNRARTIAGAAIYKSDDRTLTGDGEPERVRVARATPSLGPVLRIQPALGRWFTPQDGTPGAARVAVISHALWTRRYSSDDRVIGRLLTVGGEPAEVIGVMPAAFAFPDARVDAWMADQVAPSDGFGFWGYSGVARLREGRTLEDARSELTALAADVGAAYPNDPRASGNADTDLIFSGRTLKQAKLGGIARPLWVALAAVGLVLLVACANVANLFLVRSEARQREIAVRRALGAGGFGIARYFFTESFLLAAAGGAAGLALAWAALRAVVVFGPANLPRLEEIRLDPIVLLYTFALSVVTAIAFGAIPLMRVTAISLLLQDAGRGNTAGRGRLRARQVLMGGQIALALVLLVASGLMVRSLANLRAVDPGFNAASTLTFNVGLPDRDYPTLDAVVAAHHDVLERLASLPGVTAAATSTCLPFAGGCSGNTVRIEGRVTPNGSMPPLSLFRAVSGGYFETIGMRILKGRGLDRGDVDRKAPVAVINNSFARRIFPNEDPIGKRVATNQPPSPSGQAAPRVWLEIVGVVSETPVFALGEPNPTPQLYMPMSIAGGPDTPSNIVVPSVSMVSYVVRTLTPPLDLLPAARNAIRAFDRDLAIAQPRTLQDILDRASAQMAFTMVLLAVAAAVALLLGVIGIYGVMSYIVSQRTSEIGVRIALGADPAGVASAIVRQGGVVALAGVAVGVAAALAGGRAIEALLFGVSPRDPVVFLATTLTLLLVALIACWVPARRAARLSPVDALRS
jgi:putative ABC transport system permease protein